MSDRANLPSQDQLLLIYDGQCLLCNRFIKTSLQNDNSNRLRAAALQDYNRFENLPKLDAKVDSIVLLWKEEVYYKSDAVLTVKTELSSIPLFYRMLRIIPRFVRDAVYDLVAANRHRWFGKSESCILPTPDLRSKYLMSEQELRTFFNTKEYA